MSNDPEDLRAAALALLQAQAGDVVALAEYLAATTVCPDCASQATVERHDRPVSVRLEHKPGCPLRAGVTQAPS